MTHAHVPAYTLPRRTPEASHLRTAEQAVAYLVAAALRDGGSIPLSIEDRLRQLCSELDAAYAVSGLRSGGVL